MGCCIRAISTNFTVTRKWQGEQRQRALSFLQIANHLAKFKQRLDKTKFTVLQRSSALWHVLCSFAGDDKEIPLQAWSGPERTWRMRPPDFNTIDTTLSAPQEIFLVLIFVGDSGAVLQIGRSLVRSQVVSLEFFIDIKSFRSHYGPGVDSAPNRNEYQEYFLGVESRQHVRLTTLPPSCAVVT